MLAVTTSPVLLHAASASERPTAALNKRRARARSKGVLLVIVPSSPPSRALVSVNDKSEVVLVASDRLNVPREAVDPVDAGQQCRRGIRHRRKSVIGARQLALSDRANHIRR